MQKCALTALTKPTGSVLRFSSVLMSSVGGGGSQVNRESWLPTFSVNPSFLFQAQGNLMLSSTQNKQIALHQ